MTTPLVVLYHASCMDGFGAAWAVQRRWPLARYVPAHYGMDPSPEWAGADVVLVDFSFPRDTLLALAATARTVTVLDHHKTAQEDLAGLPGGALMELSFDAFAALAAKGETAGAVRLFPNIRVHFDMSKSGAVLAWEWAHPRFPVPDLLRYVQDRDLWQWRLPNSREINAALGSYPHEFARWDYLEDQCGRLGGTWLRQEGQALLRQEEKHVALIARNAMAVRMQGFTVPLANCPPWLASSVGEALAQGAPFAATYIDQPGARLVSLRSRGEGEDVGAIAKAYGGGGHRQAAGFKAPPGWMGDRA